MKRCSAIVCACMICGLALAENACVDQVNNKTELRKFSPKTILQGIANSCSQAGKLAGAKDKKEKEQEACNLIASFFQLAADIEKEKSENKKNKKEEDKDDKTRSEEKRVITDQTIKIVLGLVDIINAEPEQSVLRAEPGVYLSMLKDLPSDEAKAEIIEQILNDKNEAVQFLEEVINKLKNLLFVLIPGMTSDLFGYLKQYFNN